MIIFLPQFVFQSSSSYDMWLRFFLRHNVVAHSWNTFTSNLLPYMNNDLMKFRILEPPPTFTWTHPVHGDMSSNEDYLVLHEEYQGGSTTTLVVNHAKVYYILFEWFLLDKNLLVYHQNMHIIWFLDLGCRHIYIKSGKSKWSWKSWSGPHRFGHLAWLWMCNVSKQRFEMHLHSFLHWVRRLCVANA